MMKGDNLTEQISQHSHPDDRQPAKDQGLFRAAGQPTEDRHSAARTIAFSAGARPSWDVFSHASEYDVTEQQRLATPHDELTMRSLQLPFHAETDTADALDQRRFVPVDDDDYR